VLFVSSCVVCVLFFVCCVSVCVHHASVCVVCGVWCDENFTRSPGGPYYEHIFTVYTASSSAYRFVSRLYVISKYYQPIIEKLNCCYDAGCDSKTLRVVGSR
jgi:hypothetical protein